MILYKPTPIEWDITKAIYNVRQYNNDNGNVDLIYKINRLTEFLINQIM